MKKTLRILAVAIFGLMLFQNCQKSDFLVITGIVRDSITNKPIEGAYVITENQYFITGSDGTFTAEGVRPGKTDLRVFSFNGYHQKQKTVIISEGRVNKVDFDISPVGKPEIITGKVSIISLKSAQLTGNIKLKSGDYIQQYGHCWSSSNSEPTISASDNYSTHWNAWGEVDFTSNLSGLQSDVVYYVRAYAQTQSGIFYGNTVVFRTSDLEVNSGLLIYYPFNYSFSEASGNELYTYSVWNYPALVRDRKGNLSSACEFDGSGLTGLYTYNYTSNSDLNDFSISLWFNKSNTWESSTQKLLTIGYQSWLQVYISQGAPPNNFYYGIRVGGIDYKITLSSYPSLNDWHHVVAQRRGSELELYIDGNLAGKTNCSSEIINNYQRYMFMGFTWNKEHFKGKLDEIRLYNRALTNTEIQYLKSN